MATPGFPRRFFFALAFFTVFFTGFFTVFPVLLKAADTIQGQGPIGQYQFASILWTSGTITGNYYRNGSTLSCPFGQVNLPKNQTELANLAVSKNLACTTDPLLAIKSAALSTPTGGVCVQAKSPSPSLTLWGLFLYRASVSLKDLGNGSTCGSALLRPQRQPDGGAGGQSGDAIQLFFEGTPSVASNIRFGAAGDDPQDIGVSAGTSLPALATLIIEKLTERQYVVENLGIGPLPDFDDQPTLRIQLDSYKGNPITMISEFYYANDNHIQEDDLGYGIVLPFPPDRDFRRGDVTADGKVDIADGIAILSSLFLGGPPLTCLLAADSNGDGHVNLSDAVYIFNYQFTGGAQPPAPFPGCGAIPSDSLGCETSNCP